MMKPFSLIKLALCTNLLWIFIGIIPMEDGQFLVINDIDAVTGRQQADIFNKEGKFIGQVARNHWAFVRPDPRFIPRTCSSGVALPTR